MQLVRDYNYLFLLQHHDLFVENDFKLFLKHLLNALGFNSWVFLIMVDFCFMITLYQEASYKLYFELVEDLQVQVHSMSTQCFVLVFQVRQEKSFISNQSAWIFYLSLNFSILKMLFLHLIKAKDFLLNQSFCSA